MKFGTDEGRQISPHWCKVSLFDRISVKISVLGSYTLTFAAMGVKVGMETYSMPNFTLIGVTCRPWGAKNLKISL